MTAGGTSQFTAIIPVKPWADAKRRLGLTAAIRSDLARAFAEDVIQTVAETPMIGRILIVSSEPGITSVVRRCGTDLIADPVRPRGDRLNASVAAGASWARLHRPFDPVVVVPADLPCLTPRSLCIALAGLGERDRAVVEDATGEGTSLLLAAEPRLLEPAYGAGSAARHRELGYHALEVPRRVRHDVDSLADLIDAVQLGVGTNTDAALMRYPVSDLADVPTG